MGYTVGKVTVADFENQLAERGKKMQNTYLTHGT